MKNFLKSKVSKHPIVVAIFTVVVSGLIGKLFDYYDVSRSINIIGSDNVLQSDSKVTINDSPGAIAISGHNNTLNISQPRSYHLDANNIKNFKKVLLENGIDKNFKITVTLTNESKQGLLAEEIKEWLIENGFTDVSGVDDSFGSSIDGNPVRDILITHDKKAMTAEIIVGIFD